MMKVLHPLILALSLVLFLYSNGSSQCLTLVGSAESAPAGESVCVDITAREFVDIGYYQYSLVFDPEMIRFDSIINVVFPSIGDILVESPQAGILTVSWDKFTTTPFTAPPDISLYQLCFTAIGDPGDLAVIRFSDQPLDVEARAVNNIPLNFAGLSPSINIGPDNSPLRISNACPEDLDCATGNGGNINISVSGSGNLEFNWSGPDGFSSSNEDISGELDGTFRVEVTDENGNEAAGIFTIDLVNPVQITNVDITDAQCAGVNDGAVDVTVSGGSGQYDYIWSNGSTEQDLSNVGGGTYTLIVTDAEGCGADTTVSIDDLGTLEICAVNVACETAVGMDGTIDISICGGNPPYQIAWSNGATTEDIEDLTTGLYTVTVTDNSNCEVTSSPIEVCSSDFDPDGACFTVMAVPTTAPTGEQVCVDILANNFTDIAGLQMSMTWNKNNLELVDVTNFGIPDLSEDNFNTANALASNGPLLMVWDDPMLQGVSVDDETVMFQLCFNITGNNGSFSPITFTNSPVVIQAIGFEDGTADVVPVQTINGSVTIGNSADPLKVTLSCAKEPDCFGTQAGLIDIIVTGGTPPYSYQWNTGETSQDLENLFAGDYSVTVSDAANSSAEFSVTLQGFEAIILNSSVDTILCQDGRLDLFINAPSATEIQWTPENILSCSDCPTPQATITESVLIQVEVIDDQGCTESRDIQVIRSDSLVIENFQIIENMNDPPSYFVTFDIRGGNPATYNVTGIPGALSGKTFTSSDIDGELPYFFTIDDGSICSPSTIKGPGILPCEEYVSCVWPGDANTDGEVNHLDAFNLGLTYGQNGPARVLNDNNWTGHYADDWPGSTPSTFINSKHADSNGDGTVDDDDRVAILNNYGRTNSFGVNDVPFGNGTAITLGIEDGEFNPGANAELDVFLGTPSLNANDVYAVAFTVQLNTFFIAPGSAFVTFDDCWLRDGAQSIVTVQRVRNNNRLDVAISRKDGLPISGEGAIAQLHFTLRTDIFDGQTTDTLPLSLGLSDILFIDENENYFTAVPDPSSSLVIDNTISVVDPELEKRIELFPNPAKNELHLRTENLNMQQIEVYSKEGKHLRSIEDVGDAYRLEIEDLTPGFYFLRIYTPEGIGVKHFVRIN